MSTIQPVQLPGDDALFHLLVDTVQDYAIFALDAEGRIVTWNRGAEQIKQYGADDVIGRQFSLFFTDEDREAGLPDRLLLTAREEGRALDEGWRVRRDGSRFWASAVITALHNPDGELVGFAKVTRDLTERRLAEVKALQLAREHAAREAAEAHAAGLRFLIEASEQLVLTSDYEGALRQVAALAVRERADWCAIDLLVDRELRPVAAVHADPAKQRLAERLAARYPPRMAAAHDVQRVIATGEPAILRELGEDLSMLRSLDLQAAVIVPLLGRGGMLGALTFARSGNRPFTDNDVSVATELGRHLADAVENARLQLDLEERNQRLAEQAVELELQAEELQAQVAHNEELLTELEAANEELVARTAEAEEANRAKSDFLAAMSHELRTPLNAIFGYADLIQLGLHGPVTSAQNEALERIKRNQEALLVLINDLLSFARLEAGGLVIDDVELPLAPIISDLEKLVTLQLTDRGLEYRCRPFPADLIVRGDRERIEQILRNLLTNAIKFTDPGGRIIVSVDFDATTARVHVEDTGRGIPPDRTEAIFDPFVQLDRMHGESNSRGVGLGLAISRELAHAMGGTLGVASEVGRGSVFTLSLRRC